MSMNRSIRSNASLSGRTSPNAQSPRSDYVRDRPASPLTSKTNIRSSVIRQQDADKHDSPPRKFTEGDLKFHRITFERCADLSRREHISNHGKFIQALNYVGYDLPKTTIERLWSENDHEISWKTFQGILNDEKPIDDRTLEEALEVLYNKDKKHDWHGVEYNRFRTDMLEKGDRFNDDEFEKLRRLLGTENGKVDVKKLTKNIGENKTHCRQKIITEKKEQKIEESQRPPSRENSPKPNYNNNLQIIIDPTMKKLSLPSKTRVVQTKGAFFCEYIDSPTDTYYYSIGYSFELKKPSSLFITLDPTTTSRYFKDTSFKNLDVRILLLEKLPRSTERRLLHMSSDRSGTKTYLQVEGLPKGSYEIIPVTFGGILRPRSREVNERPPSKTLREVKKGNHFAMTKDYRDALEFVFDLFDLDDNKQLDRQEYNLWTIRTTAEEINDQDWRSIQNHVNLDAEENISREKFLKLNDFEVQDENTTEQDLWNGLRSVGFNHALELDTMCSFNLSLHINEQDIHLKPTSYVELTEIKKMLSKFLQNKGKKIKVNNSSIQCFNYQDDCGAILFVENTGASNVRLSIQIKNQINAAVSLPLDTRKATVVNVRNHTTQIVWFAHKIDSQRAMELEATVETQ